ncbi:MAG: aspartate-semialdehyde dehydrogenase [Planctomycetota bacterium]
MSSDNPVVAIVGATGAVGEEFLNLISERDFPFSELKLLASKRSAGKALICAGKEYTVEELTAEAFRGVDIALFSAGGSISKEFGPVARDAGCLVIDNSSAFRMDPATPLVIPEVNPEALDSVRARSAGSGAIIANPNCSTIIMMVPVHPIRERFGIERMVVSTYQAVSGAGAAAMRELVDQTRAELDGIDRDREMFAEQCAFNVFAHDSKTDEATGRNVEEQKMIDEPRKMWNDPDLRVSATCVRVPVLRAHSESINLTLKRPATETEIRDALAAAPGIEMIDDRANGTFPTPRKASGQDPVFVGRVRIDESPRVEGTGKDRRAIGFDLFVSGDQIRKGAALNALQIAELLVDSKVTA